MAAPRPEDVELARRGAQAALYRLKDLRTPREDGVIAPGASQRWRPCGGCACRATGLSARDGGRLRDDGGDQDESDLVNAMRQLWNAVTHKIQVVSHQRYAPMWLGISAIVGESKLYGGVELCWIPTDELRRADPRVNTEVYEQYLADLPAYASLRRAVGWLTGAAVKFRSDGSSVVWVRKS